MPLSGRLGPIYVALIFHFGSVGYAQSPVEWLPASTMVYAELNHSKEILETLESHPLTQRVFELPQAKEAMKSKPFQDFKKGVAVAETQLESSWQEIIDQVAGQGMVMAVDGDTDAVALLVHARSEASLARATQAFIQLAKLDAAAKGSESPIKAGEYRDLVAYSTGDARWLQLGEWLAITDQAEFGKTIVDRYLDRPQDHLGTHEAFAEEKRAKDPEADLWVWVDVNRLREKNPDEDIYQERTDNPIAELLLGGLLNIASQTDVATLSLQLDRQAIRTKITAPWNPRWIPEAREYYWGFGGTGEAPGIFDIDGSILQLSAYRDLSEMWLRAEELLKENAVDGIVQANGVLSTLFSGKDFGEDILAELEPTIDLVIAERSVSESKPQPSVKLPAFALVFELTNPEAMQPQLKRIFQSLIGFINITGAMNGQPQLELDIERTDGSQFVLARFVVEEEYDSGLPVQFNFSPTLGFSGRRFVLSSDFGLAQQLATAPRNPTTRGSDVVNTTLNASVKSIAQVLNDNRESLVAQNMLEEGNDREEAETEIGTLLSLIQLFRAVNLTLAHTDETLSIEFIVETETLE